MDEPIVSNPAPAPAATANVVKFYDISLTKLISLTLITCGAFEMYWFYKNWSIIKNAEGGKYSAIIRAIFAIFWTDNLFGYIEKKAKEKGYHFEHPIVAYAAWFIVLSVCGNLFNRLTPVNLAMDLGGFLLIYLTLVPIIYMQRGATAYNRTFDSDAGYRSGFSGVEVIWLVCGLIFFSLQSIGVYMNYNEGYPLKQRDYSPSAQELAPLTKKDYDGKLTKLGTLRKCSSFSCETIRDLNEGTAVHVIDTDAAGAWFYVSTAGNNGSTTVGWMTSQRLVE